MADEHKTEQHADHGLAHTTPVGLLIGVWGVLMVGTVLTVWCARQGLGSQLSFMVAMTIATIKAGFVIAFFMHLYWDKRLNTLAFLGAFLFVMLFISMALTDKSEYKPDLDRKIADDTAQAGGK